MKQKKLLLLLSFLLTMSAGLFAQGTATDEERQAAQEIAKTRIPKYVSATEHEYEHVMFFTVSLFEGDVLIPDFEVAVLDENGKCRGEGISGMFEPNIAYVTIHGTSGREKDFTVHVVYGDQQDRYKYDRQIEGYTIFMSNNQMIGHTLNPFPLRVTGPASFRWQVGSESAMQQGTPAQLNAELLQGATRLELNGKWEKADVDKMKTFMPKATLQTVQFSSDFAKTDLSGMLAGCSSLVGTQFNAVPEGAVTDLFAGANPNNIIYVPKGTTAVPRGWTNVVVPTKAGYDALTDFTLEGSSRTKVSPFALDKDINLNDHTATFTPIAIDYANGAGGWNTLVLPFDADLYAGEKKLKMYRSSTASFESRYWLMDFTNAESNEISFSYVTRGSIPANIPYIYAVPGDRFGDFSLQKQKLTFRSAGDQIIAPPSQIANPDLLLEPFSCDFFGTYSYLQNEPAYVLSKLKETHANVFAYTKNAKVLPFRGYMKARPGSSATARMLFINPDYIETGIDEVAADETAVPQVIYDLSGRRVPSWEEATPGIYIVNGKKQLKR